MEINLLPILNYEGKKIEISDNVEVHESDNDSFKIKAPVYFEGSVLNIGGTIELKGKAKASLSMLCDRCADYYDKDFEFEIEERFKKDDGFSDNEDTDVTILEGSSIDLSEILYTNMFMEFPSKSLCSDDCAGLCAVCGKNLNHGSCDCESDSTDPRFDILDKLL